MRVRDIRELVEGTSDCAFAVDGTGSIAAWNRAAEKLFGLTSEKALGMPCGDILQGVDECGPVCSHDCTVQQSVRKNHPLESFDVQVQTANGKQWCNVSILITKQAGSAVPYSIHIVRPVELGKRLELLVRDFLVCGTGLPPDQASAILSSGRGPAAAVELSNRELEVLRLLGQGAATAAIASKLHISRTTVNNHVQHIFRKLGVHSRLEAVRRAERAGLI